jgi:hypothetical protein
MKPVSQAVFIAIKQWTYETCEKLSPSHSLGRVLAFNSTQLWEFLSVHVPAKPFTIPFCPKYAQLYALVSINTCIMEIEPLQKRYAKQDILSLSHNAFPQQLVYGLQQDIFGLNRAALIKKPTLLKHLEDLLAAFPQTIQIRNVSLILLDAFNLQYISLYVDGPKVAAAALAVSRFWVLESEAEKWPAAYEVQLDLKVADFKEQYDQMYAVAYNINQKNIAKKKAEAQTIQQANQQAALQLQTN